jgi:hypothetical protein
MDYDGGVIDLAGSEEQIRSLGLVLSKSEYLGFQKDYPSPTRRPLPAFIFRLGLRLPLRVGYDLHYSLIVLNPIRS